MKSDLWTPLHRFKSSTIKYSINNYYRGTTPRACVYRSAKHFLCLRIRRNGQRNVLTRYTDGKLFRVRTESTKIGISTGGSSQLEPGSRLETISRWGRGGGGQRAASRYPGNKRKSKLTQRICPRTKLPRQMEREAEPCWRNKTRNKVTLLPSFLPLPETRFMGSALDLIYNWFYPSLLAQPNLSS